MPPVVLATPADVGKGGAGPITWWKPRWQDQVLLLGWRWVYLTPTFLLVALLVGAVFLGGVRDVLLVVGFKLLVFMGAVAITLSGYAIKQAAKARTEPFCIHCGYNLSGLPDNYRCPECGRPYNWRLIEEYRRDPKWFVKRWKLHHELPPADAPFDAGPRRPGQARERAKDGTE